MEELPLGVGYQVFVEDGGEEIGSVRAVRRDHLLVYVENAGDFEVRAEAIRRVGDGKVVLDPARLDAAVRDAIAHAHDREEPSPG
jgi:hypothetical protein